MEQDQSENFDMEVENLDQDQSEYMESELGRADYIVETVETWIKEGEFREGEKLPSERVLAEKFSVSRMTARRALQMLEAEGLVVTHPQRGTFVTGIRKRLEAPTVAAEELRKSGSFPRDIKRIGHEPDVEFLEKPALIAADAKIAEHLQLQIGALVLKRYRLQFVDKLPYRLIESYYPADLFAELLTTDIGDKPLFIWLKERHGLRVAHAKEVLVARLATTDERRLLRISPTASVVNFDRTVWANTGRPVEWAHITAVAARYTFIYEYDIPDLS